MTSYVEFARRLLAASWLRRKWWTRWQEAIGQVFDDALANVIAAVTSRFVGFVGDDGLALHGDDRAIERYPSDATAPYRARLRDPWRAHARGGTSIGVQEQLVLAGFPTAQVLENRGFNVDGDLSQWARFWVVILPPSEFSSSLGVWSDPGAYDDGGVWDDIAPIDGVVLIRRVVRTWKAAHAAFQGVAIVMSGELWDVPPGVWDDGGTWDDGAEVVAYVAP